MNNITKSVCILFALFIFALSLTGCDNPPWEKATTLFLKIDTPKDGATVNTPTITVSGRVGGKESKGTKVTINNADTPVVDGKYTADVTLTEGKNIITIIATNGPSKPEQRITVTYNK